MINRLFFLVVAALAYFNYAAAIADIGCSAGFNYTETCIAHELTKRPTGLEN